MATRTKDIQVTTEDLVTAREAREPARQPLTSPADNPVTYPLNLPEGEARLRTPAVGQRASRPDGRLHGLGQTQYIDDITLPHMIHAKILRSEYPHARILNVDTSEAEAMPGVYATLTGAEIPENSFGPTLQDQPVLAYPDRAPSRRWGRRGRRGHRATRARRSGEDQGRLRATAGRLRSTGGPQRRRCEDSRWRHQYLYEQDH